MKNFIPFLVFYFFFQLKVSNGQDIIHLQNPSFEDIPRPGIKGIYFEKNFDLRKNYEIDTEEPYALKDWLDCGLAARKKFLFLLAP